MKVGLVIRQFDPHRGGAERWTCQLAEHAIRAGHEVHVVAQSFGPTVARMEVVPHAVDHARSPMALADAMHQALLPLDLDVIHDMGFSWHFDIFQPHFGSWRAQYERRLMAKPPWVRVLRRTITTLSPRYQRLDQLAWRQLADHRRVVIALSKLVARDLERMHGWPMERSRLIYNGVDLERFSPAHRDEYRDSVRRRLNVAEDEILVLFAAHNFALKGLPTLLRAVGHLRSAGGPVRLVVLGGGRVGGYQRMARRWGAAQSVQFLGSVEDTVPFFAAADVFALPTWYDSCSLVVLEALASGVPVITTSHNGASEILTDGSDGFVVERPDDWRQFSQHIQSLTEPRRRTWMAAASRRLAERYPMAANFRQVMDVWQHTAGSMRRAA